MDFAKEKDRVYLGSAKIRLKDLDALEDDSINCGRYIDENNVKRLVRIFKVEGCARDKVENYIPVVIEQGRLEDILKSNNLSVLGNREPLLDIKGYRVRFLHGRHRIEAARQHFQGRPYNDRWWPVQLFSSDLSQQGRWYLCTEDINSVPWSDGEIFRYLRLCVLKSHNAQKDFWLARIRSNYKYKDIVKLMERGHYKTLIDSLDRLLEYRGLWPDFHVGCLRRIFDVRCPELLVNYLDGVYDFWSQVFEDEKEAALVDCNTVRSLQSLIPDAADDDKILTELNAGLDFLPTVHGDKRETFFNRIRYSADGMIPSLATFTDDTMWLEPPLRVLRAFLGKKFGPSVIEQYRDMYTAQQNIPFEISPDEFEFLDTTEGQLSSSQCFDIAFAHLISFAWRNFPYLTFFQPKNAKGWDLSSRDGKSYDEFVEFANRMGFNLPRTWSKSIKVQIESNLRQTTRPDKPTIQAEDLVDEFPPQDQRNGRPQAFMFRFSRGNVVLGKLYRSPPEELKTSSFMIARSIFRAFMPLQLHGLRYFSRKSSEVGGDRPHEQQETGPTEELRSGRIDDERNGVDLLGSEPLYRELPDQSSSSGSAMSTEQVSQGASSSEPDQEARPRAFNGLFQPATSQYQPDTSFDAYWTHQTEVTSPQHVPAEVKTCFWHWIEFQELIQRSKIDITTKSKSILQTLSLRNCGATSKELEGNVVIYLPQYRFIGFAQSVKLHYITRAIIKPWLRDMVVTCSSTRGLPLERVPQEVYDSLGVKPGLYVIFATEVMYVKGQSKQLAIIRNFISRYLAEVDELGDLQTAKSRGRRSDPTNQPQVSPTLGERSGKYLRLDQSVTAVQLSRRLSI